MGLPTLDKLVAYKFAALRKVVANAPRINSSTNPAASFSSFV